MSVKQGGPSHTTTDQAAITADQLLLLLQKRNILWKLQLGTNLNLNVTVGSDIRVQLDGDSDPILARTLIGPVNGVARLAILFVPPAGYYVIGTVGGLQGPLPVTIPQPLAGVNKPAMVSITAQSATITTETVLLTLPSMIYQAGRAYRIFWGWSIRQVNVGAARPHYAVREGTTVAGTLLGDGGELFCSQNANKAGGGFVEFTNATNADITTSLVLTLADAAAIGCAMFASAAQPSWFGPPQDIGAAAQMSGLISLV